MHRILSLILIAASSLPAFAAEDKSEAQYTIEVLDAFCIQNQDDFNNIIPMAESAGGRVLPSDQADPAMRKLGANTVYVPYEGRNYVVGFANKGGCTVVTKKIDLANLKSLLVKHFKVEQIDRQSSLAQVREMFEVRTKGIYQGAVLSIVYAQKDTGYEEGSISFLPTTTIKRATTSLGNAKDTCKIVNGFNLCEDAEIIAKNTSKEVGVSLRGAEYVLKSVHADHMTVISLYENIYSKKEVQSRMKELSKNSTSTSLSTQELTKLIKERSTNLLCNAYKNDPFVKDGGSFINHYSYKGGEVFHTVLIGKNHCGER